MSARYPFEPPRRSPDEAFHREVWLQIYLPLLIGLLLVGGLLAAAILSPTVVGVSTLADVSLVFVLAQLILMAIVPLVLIVALAVGVWALIRILPEYFRQAADVMARVADQTRRASRYARSPSLAARSLGPALWRVARGLVTSVLSRS